MKKSLPLLLCLICLKAFSQNSMVGDGFGGRSWYVPHNYQVGSYSGFTVCDSNNQLYGWGDNHYSQLGYIPWGPSSSDTALAVPGMTHVKFYTTGYMSAVIKEDNTAWVWGGYYFPYTPAMKLSDVRFVDAGAAHVAFVKNDGTIWGIGLNGSGQLGIDSGFNTIFDTPVQMVGITNAVRVAAVGLSAAYIPATIILLADGTVKITGGYPWFTRDSSNIPVTIPGLTNIVDIKGNAMGAFALNNMGEVYSFGSQDSSYKVLGIGPDTGYHPPTKLIFPAGAAPIIALSASDDGEHAFALDENGKVYGWGQNHNYGQLGNGTLTDCYTPVLCATNCIDIFAGETFSYILKSNNTLWAAGFGPNGNIFMNLSNVRRLTFTQLDPTGPFMHLCAPTIMGTLPIHLLTFTAHLSEQRTVNSEQKAIVNLRWAAENEINFDRYEIERSTNGREFSKVGTVRAANNREYSYDDNVGGLSSVVGGRLYYRLKMVDKDGSFTYSKVEQVQLSLVHCQLSIAPNPASTLINVSFYSPAAQQVRIVVTDAAGKTVLQQTLQLQAGDNSAAIAVTALHSGTYFIKAVCSNGSSFVDKFVRE